MNNFFNMRNNDNQNCGIDPCFLIILLMCCGCDNLCNILLLLMLCGNCGFNTNNGCC